MPANQFDVAIVGGGPVGIGLAIDLALRDVRVCVIERFSQPQRIPKGQNLTQRSGEHFRRWGVSGAIRDASPIPPEYGNEGLTTYGSLLSGYHYDWFKRASVRAYYAADNERLPQYETERILRERAARLPNIDFRQGWRFERLDSTAPEVRIAIREGDAGSEEVVSARYLVGCDGARSMVRSAAGISETLDARSRRMALFVFRSQQLSDLLNERFPGKTVFNAIRPGLDGYWQFLGRVDLEGTWFFHAPVPDDADRDNHDHRALVEKAVGAPCALDFEHIGFWDLRFTQADEYRSGAVFIAGDAAHSHPPYGGFGLNLGFEDIRNLSWKLAACSQGWGSNALLDSYHAERHPVFASTRDDFIARMIADDAAFTARYDPAVDRQKFEAAWQERAGAGQGEVQHYVPNYAGSPIVWGSPDGRSGALGEHFHRAAAGFHLSPQALDDGVDVYDRLGPDFSLIVVGEHEDTVYEYRDAAETLGVPLT
ncbi:MAG: monooxygenase, partial [Chromatiales bacterium]|nr:monooxygenase [Chromatiales bacterium]